MAMVVKNNMSAVRTLNTLNKNSSALQKSLSKVSSGMKINSAQDDASGYAISERMRVQIRSLDQANQNTQNASSLMKTAEGATSSTVEILKSLKEKAINAATDTNTDQDRATIQKELDQYIDQIDDNALTTFNGKYLVDGSKSQEGNATYTAMTNQSLDKETTGDTKLTALKNRNGESLEIKDTDYVTASYVKNGDTYTTKFHVTSETTLKNVFEELNTLETDPTTHDAVPAFGKAQTETSAPAAAYTSVDEAKQAITDAVGADNTALLAAAKGDGSNANAQTIINAAKYIAENSADAAAATADIIAAVGTSTLADATNDLKGAINTALENVKVTLTNNNPDENYGSTSGTLTANLKDSSGTVLNTVAVKTGKVDKDGGTAVLAVGAGSANADDVAALVTAAATEAGKVVSGDAGAAASISDAIDAATALSAGSFSTTAGDTPSEVTAAVTTNVSISAGDKTAYETAFLTDKIARNATGGGGDLEILSDSKIGKNAAGDMVYTADGEKGLTVTANGEGITKQVSGLTISITDSEGNVKKSANAALDAFKTTIYAKNKSDANEMTFQVGASANQSITVGLDDMRSEALGLKGSDGKKVSVATQDKANAAVNVFDNAIQKVLDQQATIGAIESRLEYTSQNLTTSSENVQAAESTIRDADMAKEMTTYTKNNVLLQAAQSMLAQANQNSSAVLSLLQ